MSLTCWSTQEISKPSVCLQTSSFGSLLRSPSPDSLCICLSLQFEGSYNHVNPSQEEVDEGFQEAPARSTCWHQWGSSGQQHHAMECCHFWVFLSFFNWFFAFPFCLSTCFDNFNSGFLVFFLVWFVDLMILLGTEVGTFNYYCFCKSFFMVIMSIDCWWFIVLIFPFLKLQLLNSWWIICGFWVFLVVMLLGFGW